MFEQLTFLWAHSLSTPYQMPDNESIKQYTGKESLRYEYVHAYQSYNVISYADFQRK